MYNVFVACISFFSTLVIVVYGDKLTTGSALPDLIVSSEGSYWQNATFTKVTAGTADITVDATARYQVWEGFGGTFNEAGWDALAVVSTEIPKALSLLFDANDGANFIYGRIPLGASDYAMNYYTLAEAPDDYEMKNFSITRDQEKLIPYIKAALEVKPNLHLWASPWIPPSWMKDISGNMKSDSMTLRAYALYFARFIEEYGNEGLTIEAVHPQNEPGYAQVKWTIPLFISFIKDYLGPTFTERDIKTEIWCGTMSHPNDADIAKACMNDDKAMKYIKGFGLQWNLESVVATLAQKGRVWQTEHRCGNYNFEAKYWDLSLYNPKQAPNDHRYAEESWQLIRDWIVAGVHSYSAWNMVLDSYGKNLETWYQNSLLIVDRSAKKLIITPAYWVFRHFSQYTMPGATRIGTSGSNDVLAFMNPDGSIITHVYNKDNVSKNIMISITNTSYQFTIPAHAWATLCVNQAAPVTSIAKCKPVDGNCPIGITRAGNGYRIILPARESGRIELLTLTGRVLTSGIISSSGNREIYITKSKQNSSTGLHIVRVVASGGAVTTARMINFQ